MNIDIGTDHLIFEECDWIWFKYHIEIILKYHIEKQKSPIAVFEKQLRYFYLWEGGEHYRGKCYCLFFKSSEDLSISFWRLDTHKTIEIISFRHTSDNYWDHLVRNIRVQIVIFDFWLQDPSKMWDPFFWKCSFREAVSGQWLDTSFHEEICALPDLCPKHHRARPIPITALIPTGRIQQTLILPSRAIKWEKCRDNPDVGMAVEVCVCWDKSLLFHRCASLIVSFSLSARCVGSDYLVWSPATQSIRVQNV